MNGISELYTGFGKVVYRDTSIILKVDQGIVDYYYALIPLYLPKQRQKYPAHITIVRKFEQAKILRIAYPQISFEYSPYIYECNSYYYLNAWSDTIGDIRESCGLKRYRFEPQYHITIGNKK